jgi:hypothetical protein
MADKPKPLLAFVALNSSKLPAAPAILTEFQERCPECAHAKAQERDETTLTFDLDGCPAFISLMPKPIPWSELEGPCATAWWWREAAERMKGHTHHSIVGLLGDTGDIVKNHIWLSQLVAAVATQADAAGIYWAEGTLVHEPQAFADQAAALTLGDIEPQLWVDLQLEQNDDDSYRFFTTGLSSLNRPELEVDRSRKDPQEILQFCYAIICYLLNSGQEIKAGETIGRTEQEKVNVAFAPSMWNRDLEVMKLAFD